MSTEPTDEDVKLSHNTADVISSLIQVGFAVNRKIPPMPPYPAIPLKSLQETIQAAESLMHQAIIVAKQLSRHAEKKGLEVGPLVGSLATIEVPEVRIHFGSLPRGVEVQGRKKPKLP
ncbi:MAG: hypothetical protein ACE5L6_01955 [Candidatus Bathyarchaeia archaeon]